LKKAINKKGFCKSLISRCFAEGKTPAPPLLSPRRPQGGAGCKYQLFNKLTKTYLYHFSTTTQKGDFFI